MSATMTATNLAWVPSQLTPNDYVVDLGLQGAAEVKDAIKAFNGDITPSLSTTTPPY